MCLYLTAGWQGTESFPALHTLRLDGNSGLQGTLPDWGSSGELQNLRSLSLSLCRLSGTLPDWQALPHLESLVLDSNDLTGQWHQELEISCAEMHVSA